MVAALGVSVHRDLLRSRRRSHRALTPEHGDLAEAASRATFSSHTRAAGRPPRGAAISSAEGRRSSPRSSSPSTSSTGASICASAAQADAAIAGRQAFADTLRDGRATRGLGLRQQNREPRIEAARLRGRHAPNAAGAPRRSKLASCRLELPLTAANPFEKWACVTPARLT